MREAMVLAAGKRGNGYCRKTIATYIEHKCNIVLNSRQIKSFIHEDKLRRMAWDSEVSAKLLSKGDEMYAERGNTYRDSPGHEQFFRALEKAVCPGRGIKATRLEYDRMKKAQMGNIGERDIPVILRIYEEERGKNIWADKASEALNGRPTIDIKKWMHNATRCPRKYPQLTKWAAPSEEG